MSEGLITKRSFEKVVCQKCGKTRAVPKGSKWVCPCQAEKVKGKESV